LNIRKNYRDFVEKCINLPGDRYEFVPNKLSVYKSGFTRSIGPSGLMETYGLLIFRKMNLKKY